MRSNVREEETWRPEITLDIANGNITLTPAELRLVKRFLKLQEKCEELAYEELADRKHKEVS